MEKILKMYVRIFRRILNPQTLPVLLSLLIFNYLVFTEYLAGSKTEFADLNDPKFILLITGLVSSIFFLFSGFLSRRNIGDPNYEGSQFFREIDEIKYLLRKSRPESDLNLKKIETKISEIQSSLKDVSIDLNEKDKTELFKKIGENIEGSITSDLLKSIEKKYGEGIIKEQRVDDLIKNFEDLRYRLINEVKLLNGRSNTNLIFGSSLTVVAGIVLWITVVSEQIEFTSLLSLTSHYIPRLSIIIFIEIFSFFFLRLYKSTLNAIRYYQNELTNVELKTAALKAALLTNDTKVIERVIHEFAVTERNFVIPNGSTTVELERLKTESTVDKNLLDTLKTAVNKIRT